MLGVRFLPASLILLAFAFPVSGADRDLPIKARAVLHKHCAECHGDDNRKGDLSILDHAGMQRPERPFVDASADRSELMQLIEDGSMPPGNRPKLTKMEADLVREWINAAAPAYPKQFDDLYVVSAVLTDVQKQPAADRPHLRYFSIADLVADNDASINLDPAREALRQALNQLTKAPLPTLEPADPAATVFRLDLRKTGWDMKPFKRQIRVGDAAKQVPSDVNLYDLILVEYPLGRIYPNDPIYRQLADIYLKPAHQVRPLTFMRGEWFAKSFLASPVASEIRGVLERAEPKEAPPAMPKSLHPPDAPAGSIAMLPLDSVSRRDPTQPFKIEFELFDAKLSRPKARFALGDEFYFYVQSPRSVHIEINWIDATGKRVLINLDQHDRFVRAETDKLIGKQRDDGDKKKIDGIDKPTKSVPYVFSQGVPGKEYLTIFASEQPFPPGEMLKTKGHLDERVIHRFYKLPGEKSEFDFDPAKIVKKTIGIEFLKKE